MISRSVFQAPKALSRSSLWTLRCSPCVVRVPISSTRHPAKPVTLLRRFSQFRPLHNDPRHLRRVKHIRYDPREVAFAKPLIHTETIREVLGGRGFKVVVALICGAGVIFYAVNREDVPVSGRRRFNCVSEEMEQADGEQSYQLIMRQYEGSILPEWDPRVRQVMRIMKRLIPASGIEDGDWEINVIHSDECNAFVIPGGKVFVFTGLFNVAQSEDGMAAVLGHEIAHNQAHHMAEQMSSRILLLPLRYLFIFLDATGFTAGIGQLIGPLIINYGIALPASRVQESEADYIGLLMMARACYNPEAAVGLWERMERAAAGGSGPQWLSTHPSNTNRISSIQKWLPEAEEARNNSECSTTMGYMQDFQRKVIDPWASFR